LPWGRGEGSSLNAAFSKKTAIKSGGGEASGGKPTKQNEIAELGKRDEIFARPLPTRRRGEGGGEGLSFKTTPGGGKKEGQMVNHQAKKKIKPSGSQPETQGEERGNVIFFIEESGGRGRRDFGRCGLMSWGIGRGRGFKEFS